VAGIGQRIIKALERRVPEGLRGDLDTRRRAMLALGVAATIVGFCVPIAGLIFVITDEERRLLGTVNTLFTAVLASFTLPLLRRGGLVWACHWLAGLLYAGTLFAMSQGGGVFASFIMILPVITSLATIIGGRDRGVAWAGVSVATVLVFGVLVDPQRMIDDLLLTNHPGLLAAIIAAAIIVILTVFVVLSEATKREAIIQIAAATRRLEQLVADEQRARDLAAEAVAANAAKSAFLATMSHELRTPLNIILGYSELALEHLEERGDDETAEDLRRVHGAGQHLLGLISDVLDLSRIEAERIDLGREPFDLEEMIREMVLSFQPLALRADIELRAEVPVDLIVTGLDRTRVRQILLNLVSNAVKFTRAGQVHLRAHRVDDGRAVEISVRDSGIGIPPDKLEVIFLPFTQVDPSTTRRYEGTGLGLAISRRLCELMGGALTAESTLGRGSTFTVRLPCS
jgi:signal transduction histidine kinase